MDIDATVRAFSALTEKQQAIALARLAHYLTVLARATYSIDDEPCSAENAARARDINELLHRVTSAVAARLEENPNRYPDDVLVRMCADPSDNPLALSTGAQLVKLIAKQASKNGS